jgi:mRNA-degrading endonuclease RelE of RelBE toxin-antitoxin system
MGAIVIQTNRGNAKILSELVKKPGTNVLNINEEQFEDIPLGILIDELKNVRKHTGFENYYRIRLGDHRVGCEYANDVRNTNTVNKMYSFIKLICLVKLRYFISGFFQPF